MSKYVFNIVKSIVCVCIFVFNNFGMCAFGRGQFDNVNRNIHLGNLKFINDKIEICDFFTCVTVGVGECKRPSFISNFSILYVDSSDSLNQKLCTCTVSSCEDLPEDQSEWSTMCQSKLCQRIGERFINPLPFCSILFEEKNIMRFVPVEFSQQTFFNPGIRIIVLNNGVLYKRNFFLSDEDFMKKSYEVLFGGRLYRFDVYRLGYNKICADYRHNGSFFTQCVPIPVLPQPMLTRSKNGEVKISANNTSLKSDVIVGDDILNKTGIGIVKPKISLNTHGFYLYEKCKNGKILEKGEYCPNGEMSKVKYRRDDKVNVQCIDGLNTVFGYLLKYNENGYDRHIWLKPLPNKMVRYVRTEAKKYIECADYKYDLNNKTQNFLDSILINEDGYYFFADQQNVMERLNIYPGNNPCNNLKDSFYSYQSTELKLRIRKLPSFYPEILTQFTESGRFDAEVLRYFNADNKKKLSLDIRFKNKLEFLDAYSMGMCIDNFESKIYAAEKIVEKDHDVSSKFTKNEEKNNKHVDVWLSYPKFAAVHNISNKCDFVKVEIWGGGQSGIIDTENLRNEEGKPGQYVMGMFKIKKSDKYFFKIQLLEMHNQVLDDNRYTGTDAVVEFCKRGEGLAHKEICEVKLIANGGGKLPNRFRKNVIGNNLVNDKRMLYYRVVNGPRNRKSENVPSDKRIRFIPYQSFTKENLWEELAENECSSGKILEENNSKYFGAGGCADIKTHSTEKGAGSMVKITCENWYN